MTHDVRAPFECRATLGFMTLPAKNDYPKKTKKGHDKVVKRLEKLWRVVATNHDDPHGWLKKLKRSKNLMFFFTILRYGTPPLHYERAPIVH